MAKVGRRAGAGEGSKREEIRQRIIDAAFVTLRDRGYAEASARAIATTGGFDQAQIFYYFGSVNNLLVAALESSSLRQLAAYREIVRGVTSASEVIDALRTRLAEDLATGHVKVLAELIAAGTNDDALRDMVRELFEPWMELSVETVTTVLATSGLGAVLPGEQVAFAVVCLLLGVQQFVTLTGESQRALDMVDAAQKVASMFDAMFTTSGEAQSI
jgi:AcrR family transcriptional regulator